MFTVIAWNDLFPNRGTEYLAANWSGIRGSVRLSISYKWNCKTYLADWSMS
jgi:hypothetical protein